jgi:hypothetical protein
MNCTVITKGDKENEKGIKKRMNEQQNLKMKRDINQMDMKIGKKNLNTKRKRKMKQ